MKTVTSDPRPLGTAWGVLTRCAFLAALTTSQLAYAQAIPGQALINYAVPIIVALIIVAILVALGASFFAPQFAKSAVYAAVIGVVMFFVIKTAPALAAAVQN